MKLLANENFPKLAVEALRAAGHDTEWMSDVGPGTLDQEVMARAFSSGRVLVTFDKDFGELVFRAGTGFSRGIVLFRLKRNKPEEVAQEVVSVLRGDGEWLNKFCVVDERKVRRRPLPSAMTAASEG